VQRFRGGLVFKAHKFCVSLNSRLESNKEEEGTHQGAEFGLKHLHLVQVERRHLRERVSERE